MIPKPLQHSLQQQMGHNNSAIFSIQELFNNIEFLWIIKGKLFIIELINQKVDSPPNIVTREGSPPKEWIFFFTHCNATTWSLRPMLPEITSSCVDKNPAWFGVWKVFVKSTYLISCRVWRGNSLNFSSYIPKTPSLERGLEYIRHIRIKGRPGK